jgi:hypothetical protein
MKIHRVQWRAEVPEAIDRRSFRGGHQSALPLPRETASKASLSSNITKEETMGKAILLCFILAASVSALAGDSKDKSKVRDVTGCLSKGDDAKEFVLTATDGSTWEVKSDKVPLANHVGHTVTATGVVSNAKMHNMKEDAQEAAKDSGMKKSNPEHGHLTITDVKMVSESCK